MASVPTLNGVAIFGVAVKIKMQKVANAAQIDAFFGVQGVQSLDGGSRGRTFFVTGLMVGSTPAACVAAMVNLENYADGQGRLLVDTLGNAWQNVVYRNESQMVGDFVPITAPSPGWGVPYHLVLHGLT